MNNTMTYKDLIEVLDAAHNKKDINGWQTLHEFDNTSLNKQFDARVFKQGNRIVIGFAGSDLSTLSDWRNDGTIICTDKIPSQYYDAERLYNLVKQKYPNAKIEATGYSLGGTLANLLAHRTGIRSTALAPIGSKHIAEKYKDYFKYGDSNITTYGRKGDELFKRNLGKQSGKIYIIPDKENFNIDPFSQHYLHNYEPFDIYRAKPYPTGGAAPISDTIEHIFTPDEIGRMTGDEFAQNESAIMNQLSNGLISRQAPRINYAGYLNPFTHLRQIFTREDINSMSGAEYSANEKAIMSQLNSIGIPTQNDLQRSGGTVYVKPYTRSDGTYVRGYYRSV